ncbi:hypothetical protein [Ammoniphilus sp. CFH 90114]|uniref:hypothetical protein n=1 Tax=Ammoniphilus sp. CFH 90114 TaxID=2493665 RepID=UPI00100F21F7|nr:hypothetical protein [Ammoniphilus sp. CFH 90114]RXT08933.1 hypothetical protein EIZ39_09055 [Ammoniphilus sp. CFH 90114]
MIEEIRRQLFANQNMIVEVMTKHQTRIQGKLTWLSPDRSMAEITLHDGQIKTITDIDIKNVVALEKA